MNQIKFELTKVDSFLPLENEMWNVAFVLEQSLQWMFIHGVYSWSIHKIKKENGCLFSVLALVKPKKEVIFSKAAIINDMAENGYIPKNLQEEDLWKEVVDGQSKATSKRIGEETILGIPLLDSKASLGDYVFGLADIATGMFAMGGQLVKSQTSMSYSQIAVDCTMNKNELKQFAESTFNYHPKRTIGETLWGERKNQTTC